MASGLCCILAHRRNGGLSVGVTRNLSRQIYGHRMGLLDGFTSRYGMTPLALYEEYPRYMDAVQREKKIKHRSRAWKTNLIGASNPEWIDLYEQLM